MSISDTSQRIRRAFNDNLCKSVIHQVGFCQPCHQKCADILQYYGPRPFKCKFPQCELWQHGFEQRGIRDHHELSHDKPLKCHVSGCEFEVIGFLSEKMRKDHMEKAHQHNSSGLHRESHNPTKIEIETILLDLVKDDDLEAVKRVLSEFPALLSSNLTFKSKLLEIAAFQASSSMLTLIGPGYAYDVGDHCFGYVQASIQGHNLGTLSHLLARTLPTKKMAHGRLYLNYFPFDSLLSTDWYDGTKAVSKWLRNGLYIAEGTSNWVNSQLFGGKHIIQTAAKCHNGNRHLLCLWEESGITPRLNRGSMNRILQWVIQVNCSPDLVEYWLNKGAEVNWRISASYKTMLHHAAQHTSQQAALVMEMLLLNGANPEAEPATMYRTLKRNHRWSIRGGRDLKTRAGQRKIKITGKKIRDEKGAMNIHKWLGVTWDELIERTKQQRKNKETCRMLVAHIEE
ncbi:hypothetical protein RRF57_009209 [Xylaria bambusicola]|uniref:Uncharacterized protein n=1 Tax=Xylaria bambusicola TaxID=326684 RepID=A0AAN7UJ69_9PEZI